MYVDGPTEQIAGALSRDVMRDALRAAGLQCFPHVAAALRTHSPGARTCSGEVATRVLEEAIRAISRALRTETNGYAGLRWLWLLRRLPEWVFEGDYSTTLGYDSTLAEAIAGQGAGRSRVQLLSGEQRAYPLDATVVRRLARYCASVRILSQLHREYRWAGKGAAIEFVAGQMPEHLPDETLRDSVYLYDERAEQGGGGRMGTEVFSPTRSALDLREVLRTLEQDPLTKLFRLLRVQPAREITVPMVGADLTDTDVPTALMRARYMFIPIPLANLQTLIDAAPAGQPIFDKSAAVLLFLLFASTAHVVDHRAGFVSAFQTGYLLFAEPVFRARFADAFAVVPSPIREILDAANVRSAQEALDVLVAVAGNPWPLEAGPILYRDGEALAVDLVAASRRLSDAVVYPRAQGTIANVRSAHFELRVQAAVNASRYAPPAEVLVVRGRTLKLRGRDITDLDAIARVDGSLVLLSCKSIIYSPEYDMGEYRAVRNAATTVRSAVEDWAEILVTLRANLLGDNYDLRGWDLLGVVCTPSVVWIELGRCTTFVLPGLRAAVSLAELQAWLAGEATV